MSWYKGFNSARKLLSLRFVKEEIESMSNKEKQNILIDFMLRYNILKYDPPTYQMHEKYMNAYRKLNKLYEQ